MLTHHTAGQGVDYADQWESTDHVHVRISGDDGNMSGYLNVGVAMDDSGADSGICTALEAVAAGAGLVHAAAGAGVTLASIACGAL